MPIAVPSQLVVLVMLGAGAPAGDIKAPPVPIPVQSQEQVDETAGASLAGTEWLLKSLHGMDVDPAIGSSLSFDKEGNVSGNGGCNRFKGGVTIKNQTLKFGDLASTMMACLEGERTRQEADYHAAMAETVGFRIEQGELSLLNDRNEVVARLISAQ